MMVTCSKFDRMWSTTRQAGISGNKDLGKDDFREARERRHMCIRRQKHEHPAPKIRENQVMPSALVRAAVRPSREKPSRIWSVGTSSA